MYLSWLYTALRILFAASEILLRVFITDIGVIKKGSLISVLLHQKQRDRHSLRMHIIMYGMACQQFIQAFLTQFIQIFLTKRFSAQTAGLEPACRFPGSSLDNIK